MTHSVQPAIGSFDLLEVCYLLRAPVREPVQYSFMDPASYTTSLTRGQPSGEPTADKDRSTGGAAQGPSGRKRIGTGTVDEGAERTGWRGTTFATAGAEGAPSATIETAMGTPAGSAGAAGAPSAAIETAMGTPAGASVPASCTSAPSIFRKEEAPGADEVGTATPMAMRVVFAAAARLGHAQPASYGLFPLRALWSPDGEREWHGGGGAPP